MHRKVVVSGYVFASIMHEASKSENDAEGLLCGNVRKITKDQITDSDSNGNHEELEYALFDIIPFDKTFSFYDPVGKIVMDYSKKSDSKLLIGWYKIRRNSSNRISMREKAVIRNFIEKFNLKKGLIFILCTPQPTSNQSTIAFTYKCFFCCKEEKSADGLMINIINLGHTGTHPEYRNRSCMIEPVSESVQGAHGSVMSPTAIPLICDSFENKFLQNDGTVYEVHYIRKMYRKTLEIMKQFEKNLSDIENEICSNENEILILRRKLKNKESNDEDGDKILTKNKSSFETECDDESEREELTESNTRARISKLTIKEQTGEEIEDFSDQY